MDIEKQRVMLSLLLANQNLFARVNPILKSSYFDPLLKRGISYSQEYFEQYHALPTPAIIKAETKLEVTKDILEKHEIEWVANELEIFCRHKAIEEVILSGPQLLADKDFGTLEANLKTAIQTCLNRDLGIDYFKDVKDRLHDLLNNSPVIRTGWDEVDELLGGGISRQELVLYAGISGVGKSIIMSNQSVNHVKDGYNVIYISLELADRIVSKRFDSMTTGISQGDILDNIDKVVIEVDKFKMAGAGNLFIKRMPESTTTANHIRAYLKEFEQSLGFKPDVLIVDYLDLMASNRNVSSENIWLKDKYCAEELRAVGFDFDCAIVTASQLGRAAETADSIGMGNIQGGFSKVQTADAMIAIVQDSLMRASGEYVLEFVKTRNSGGVGNQVLLKWDPIGLRVTNLDTCKTPGIKYDPKFEPKVKEELSIGGTVFDKNSTMDLFNLIKT